MRRLGFDSISLESQTAAEKKYVFENAREISIMSVSGFPYLNENEQYVKGALERGAKIRFLCPHPYSTFLNNVERLEMAQGFRARGDLISKEIFDLLSKYDGTGLEIRFYGTDYRLPMVIADFGTETKAWLTVTLPPYKSTDSFILRGTSSGGADFVDMMVTHFNAVWETTSVSVEDFKRKIVSVQQKEMTEKLAAAKHNMKRSAERGRGVLIEVAAQHPLIDGRLPNQEFQGRLDTALEIARRYTDVPVYFYVPGNLHKHNGVEDKISLSQAGTQYLIEHGIAKKRIFGIDANQKYCADRGVYNSTDECYVASRLFRVNWFAKLICVCSPAQMLRKMFSYILYGCYPEMHTFCCDEMYHDYVEEFFRAIPIVVHDDGILKGKSLEAERLRKERAAGTPR